jgi:hypothetical protein
MRISPEKMVIYCGKPCVLKDKQKIHQRNGCDLDAKLVEIQIAVECCG